MALAFAEIVGFATHAIVLLLGLGGVLGLIPLARGRRAGAGLILMALSMTVLILAPRLASPRAASSVYVVGFLTALWLLFGPGRPGGATQTSKHQEGPPL